MPEETSVLTDEKLRLWETDWYYATIFFSPPAARQSARAVLALQCDLLEVALKVGEPMLAEIRLQWWRDVIGGAGQGQRTGAPLADHLTEEIRRNRLEAAALLEIIDAWSAVISADVSAEPEPLVGWLADFEAILFRQAGSLLAGPLSPDQHNALREASEAAGRAYGSARLLTGKSPAAQILLNRHPSGEGVAFSEEMRSAMAASAKSDRARAIDRLGQLPVDMAPAFLPLALIPHYLSKRGNDRREGRQQNEPFANMQKLFRIGRAAFFGL